MSGRGDAARAFGEAWLGQPGGNCGAHVHVVKASINSVFSFFLQNCWKRVKHRAAPPGVDPLLFVAFTLQGFVCTCGDVPEHTKVCTPCAGRPIEILMEAFSWL